MGGMGTLFGFGHWDLILFDGKNASSLGRGIARFFISLGFYDGGFDGMGERIMAGFFNLVWSRGSFVEMMDLLGGYL